MRSFTFLGLICIAAAIEQAKTYSGEVIGFISVILGIAFVMDLIELNKKVK